MRVIAATNRRPEEAVAAGKLREDLLYRLNVFPIHLPTLWERREDIELLAQHFLDELNKQDGTAKEFTRAAIERLRSHRWPGNVRELRNVVQRAFIMAEEHIGVDTLPLGVSEGDGGESGLAPQGRHVDRRGRAPPDPRHPRALRGRQEEGLGHPQDQPEDPLQPPQPVPWGSLTALSSASSS